MVFAAEVKKLTVTIVLIIVALASQRAKADAEFYRVQKEAEANRLLLTP